MFARYFNHLPDELVKDILEDGFTKFNYDALSNFFLPAGEQKHCI